MVVKTKNRRKSPGRAQEREELGNRGHGTPRTFDETLKIVARKK